MKEAAEKLYQQLRARGIETLLDDRDERPGVKFADMELIGIPHHFVIGDRSLQEGVIEYKSRRDGITKTVGLADMENFIASL